ncbi:DNA polymerase III subunit delta' [Aceticella autotrophica]|uniref:DNA polymerase III subunit delta' n=1 Tax=Aceticella autotrophica TaxID=2755338 RepID=A0A975AVV3_9THEO|nr:DNA polymerase III subunit delta' C-terminal domain-containing protein [Aceticella autotrophica]QSZ27421.1 DNA polymerase III subunit delta' [Aceticella autotrophica]
MYRIYGHEKMVSLFEKIIAAGKIANAYLYLGEEGLGKEFMAKYFAMMVNCRGNRKKPCYECSSCIQMLSGNQPDIFIIKPVGNSIKVEEIRSKVIDKIYIKPYESNKKIFIIIEAEKMTQQAQNCILKTLEEPSSYGLFILTASKMEGLLPTVISRCSVIRFNRVDDVIIKKYLEEEKKFLKEKAKEFIPVIQGNFGMADKFSDLEYIKMREDLFKLLCQIITQNKLEALDSYQFFEENKNRINDILAIMMSYFRDIMVYKFTKEQELIRNKDIISDIEVMSQKLTGFRLNNIINGIENINDNLKSNINFQLTIEDFLLNL